MNWSISKIPSDVNEWLRNLPDDGSPEFALKCQQVAIVLAAQDQALPDHYSHPELLWQDLAIPVAHRQLELETQLAKLEERLTEMQDGIERAVGCLNEIDPGQGIPKNEMLWEEALAELNKVL